MDATIAIKFNIGRGFSNPDEFSMDDYLSFITNIAGYTAGAWIAFKIFDVRKKGKKRDAKDDLLLWPLLLLFFLGAGTLFSYMLRSFFS